MIGKANERGDATNVTGGVVIDNHAPVLQVTHEAESGGGIDTPAVEPEAGEKGADAEDRREAVLGRAAFCSECNFKNIPLECHRCFVRVSPERLGRTTTAEPEPECTKDCYLRDPCKWCLIEGTGNIDTYDSWCPGCKKPNATPCRCDKPRLKVWGRDGKIEWAEIVYYCEACGGCRCPSYNGAPVPGGDKVEDGGEKATHGCGRHIETDEVSAERYATRIEATIDYGLVVPEGKYPAAVRLIVILGGGYDFAGDDSRSAWHWFVRQPDGTLGVVTFLVNHAGQPIRRFLAALMDDKSLLGKDAHCDPDQVIGRSAMVEVRHKQSDKGAAIPYIANAWTLPEGVEPVVLPDLRVWTTASRNPLPKYAPQWVRTYADGAVARIWEWRKDAGSVNELGKGQDGI